MFGEFNGPAAAVSLHPNDAERARPTAPVDRAVVFNDRARSMPVRIDADLLPGVCSIPKGLWRRRRRRAHRQRLVPDELSDLAGGACFNDARVEVRPDRRSAEGTAGVSGSPPNVMACTFALEPCREGPVDVRDHLERAELVYGDRTGVVDEPTSRRRSWGR